MHINYVSNIGFSRYRKNSQPHVGRNTVNNFETAIRIRGSNKGVIASFSFTQTRNPELGGLKPMDYK